MFTPEELQKLLNILDFAVKAGGLSVVNEILPLAEKIQTLIQSVDVQKEKA